VIGLISVSVSSIAQLAHAAGESVFCRDFGKDLLSKVTSQGHRQSRTLKNSPDRGLRWSPQLDLHLGWPWKSYRRECLIDL